MPAAEIPSPPRFDDVSHRLGALAAQVHAATAEMVLLLGELEASGGWGGVGLRSLGHWASIDLGISSRTAAAQARAGRILASAPLVAAAARAGELGWDKLKLLVEVVEPATDARWLAMAREMSVGQLGRVVAAFRRAGADPSPGPHGDEAHRRRGVWRIDEPDGLVRLTALLDPEDAAAVWAAIAAHAELLWRAEGGTADGEPGSDGEPDAAAAAPSASEPSASEPATFPASPAEVDPRHADASVPAARRADALAAIARRALDEPGLPDLADDSTQVTLVVDAELLAGQIGVGRCHLGDGPSVPPETARRLSCDALVRPLLVRGDDSQPLDLGRTTRTVNRAQRRALQYRDRGCTFPGCGTTVGLAAHHVVHWTSNGPTDLANLTLLCRFHHRLHHEGGYAITMDQCRPQFHRPDGTRIGPPAPPPRERWPKPPPVDHRTPRARSGGAPHWSPQQALDGLLS